MKKSIIALSAIAALSTSSFAAKVTHTDMMGQIEALKAQLSALEGKLNSTQSTSSANKVSLENMMNSGSSGISDARFKKLEKKVSKIGKKANLAKAKSAGDNLKWNVDLRTQIDNIQYKHADGSKSKNNALMTNRLHLGMKYAADENSIFYGTLSYLKAFGDSANHSQANTNPGYANFDWVTNENALDNSLKVKEAYWLYRNDSFFGNEDVAWTASVGRRPSTDGLGINVRADQNRKSALSHTVNVEFDGASARFELDKITGVEGMWLKFCAGRGLTNAKARFQMDGTDYSEDKTLNPDVDMAGVIFVPYDNGQYSVHANYAKSWNLIGYDNADIGQIMSGNPQNATFNDVGDIEFATVMFKVDGIGDGISDYLDDTNFFASYAMSKTSPRNGEVMLGSADSETGHSFWIGANAPCPISDKARIGIEWNKGSKHWRSMTYGEDTMAGSKIATRGTAWEIYRHQQLTKALSFGVSYTHIDYDYMGSNAFFGAEGAPTKIGSAQADAQNAVESAQDIKAYMRYRF